MSVLIRAALLLPIYLFIAYGVAVVLYGLRKDK